MYLEEKKILGQSLEECVVERRLGNTEKNLVFDKKKLWKKKRLVMIINNTIKMKHRNFQIPRNSA